MRSRAAAMKSKLTASIIQSQSFCKFTPKVHGVKCGSDAIHGLLIVKASNLWLCRSEVLPILPPQEAKSFSKDVW